MPLPMPTIAMQMTSSVIEPWNAITSSSPRPSITQPRKRNGPLPLNRYRYPVTGPISIMSHSTGTITHAPMTGSAPSPLSPGTRGICAKVDVATSAPNSPNPARTDTALLTHTGRDQNAVWSTSGLGTRRSMITQAIATTTAITIRKMTSHEPQPQVGSSLNAMSSAIAGMANPTAPNGSTTCHHLSGAPAGRPRPSGTNRTIPTMPSTASTHAPHTTIRNDAWCSTMSPAITPPIPRPRKRNALISEIATLRRITGNSSLMIPASIGNSTSPTPLIARPTSSSGRLELMAAISAPTARQASPKSTRDFFHPIVSPRRHSVGTNAAPDNSAIRLIQIAATGLMRYAASSEVSSGTSMFDGIEEPSRAKSRAAVTPVIRPLDRRIPWGTVMVGVLIGESPRIG